MNETITERLEYLRGEIQAERISQAELIELQSLAVHIDRGDVELLEWAGVPEFGDAPFIAAAEFEDFVSGYFDAMLRANTYDGRRPEFEWADDALVDVRDGTLTLDDAAAAELEQDCRDFLTPQAVRLIHGAMRRGTRYQEYGWAGAGHDFALTRNGHGVGFWDRGFGIVGEALTKLAKPYGTRSLYVDHDDVVRIFE